MFKPKDRLYVKGSTKAPTLGRASRPRNFEAVMAGLSATPENGEETANFQTPFSGKSGMSMSAIGGGAAKSMDSWLVGFVDDKNHAYLRKYYKDIYENDNIGGSAVDLTSSLPFSDFSLTGADDKTLEVYKEACDRLNIVNLMPIITAEYLVYGAFVGQLIYDPKKKNFQDILPYDLDSLEFEDMPFFSLDPTIVVNTSERMQSFLDSDSKYISKFKKALPRNLLQAMESGSYELDPLSTLYVPRQTFSEGTRISYFRRMLPIYLFEKALYRGTIVEAYKRLRSLLHIAAGDEYWEATAEELSTLVGAFQRAELDPLGAIVATRNGINVSEVRQGGDFWKWTDVADSLTPLKLKALAISEAFLSGDASYNNSETALSVYIESLRTLRGNFTYRIFYNRIFPTISAVHGNYKNGKKGNPSKHALDAVNENSAYLIPEVRWHKALTPFADRDTLDLLDEMTQKGLPPQLRTLAAAGGINLENYLKSMDEDIELRKRLKKYNDQLAELAGGMDGGMDLGDVDAYSDDAQFDDELTSQEDSIDKLAMELSRIRPSLKKAMSRDYGNASEIVGKTKTGKDKYIHNQKAANRKHNENLVKGLKNLSDPNEMKKHLALAKRLGINFNI